MHTLVMKFGGSAVGTTAALAQVLSIVLHEREAWDRLLLVVSALDGVTDALLEAAHLAQMGNQRGYRRIIANLRTRHLALIEELPLGANERGALQKDIDSLLFDLLDMYQNMVYVSAEAELLPRVDAAIGAGEKLAARIIAALLRQNNIRSVALDATNLIITDDNFGNAAPILPLTNELITENLLPMLERSIVPVITGFIGATKTGKPTTLGRGGSDLTASIIAVCAGAKEVWMWTDVDGMMSADPHEIAAAQVIPTLSYDEVGELAYFGARILHTRMVAPLRQAQIPLRIKNVVKPQQPGTLIHTHASSESRRLKAVTAIGGLGLAADASGSLASIAALVDQTLFATTRSHADVMISAQSSAHSFVCFLIPTNAGPDAIHVTRTALEEALRQNPDTLTWKIKPVSIITVISNHFEYWSNPLADLLKALPGCRFLALAQGPSQCSFSLVVEPEFADDLLAKVHSHIIHHQ